MIARIGLIVVVVSLQLLVVEAIPSLLDKKNVTKNDIEKWKTAFPKSAEFGMIELVDNLGSLMAIMEATSTKTNETTFDEWLQELKKINPSVSDKAKKVYEENLKVYNGMKDGKGKDLIRKGYLVAWKLPTVNLGVSLSEQVDALIKMKAATYVLENLAKELPKEEWDTLVELFPLTCGTYKDALPEKIRQRLTDLGIIS